MKQLLSVRFWIGLVCTVVVLASPLLVWAEEVEVPVAEPPTLADGVVVAEVQTGSADTARADEFIELFNTTAEPVDLTGWQLRYITASATSPRTVEDPNTVINLTPPEVEGVVTELPPGGRYVLYAGAVQLPDDVLGQSYGDILPATGGSLVLVRPDDATCEFVVEDALAWGATTHLFGEGEAAVAGSSSAKDRLFQRYTDETGVTVDTDINAIDFLAVEAVATGSLATPGLAGAPVLPTTASPGSGVQSRLYEPRFNNAGCSVPKPPVDPPSTPPTASPPSTTIPPGGSDDDDPAPAIPAANKGLASPQLSEVLPNPASPQTDAADEFIELYNPNDAQFDLSGYVLEAGLTSKRRYTFPTGTVIGPRAFLAFFPATTRLTLSNSGSQVTLLDPLGRVLVQTDVYGTAKEGQAWLLANGAWQWTTRPTPNGLNAVSTPVVKQAKSTTAKSSKSSTASKTASNTKAETAQDAPQSAVLAATTRSPFHPSVLALVAVSAVLYGAYEYRRDVANKIYQFRANRAARAAFRQSTKGR